MFVPGCLHVHKCNFPFWCSCLISITDMQTLMAPWFCNIFFLYHYSDTTWKFFIHTDITMDKEWRKFKFYLNGNVCGMQMKKNYAHVTKKRNVKLVLYPLYSWQLYLVLPPWCCLSSNHSIPEFCWRGWRRHCPTHLCNAYKHTEYLLLLSIIFY